MSSRQRVGPLKGRRGGKGWGWISQAQSSPCRERGERWRWGVGIGEKEVDDLHFVLPF